MTNQISGKNAPRVNVLVGLTRVLDCCVFAWQQSEGSPIRTVVVDPGHCARCVNEVERHGFVVHRRADTNH